ncbi:hypothetical protein I8752_34020 [Nostocaceae cyanobacterium CENA369]|uniref:Uncharacterized protein n=1 Tax=Dendronalium phyllosphericum CENA369 TaxID=1725256 RepID=A0A8J7IUP4_9NOST|nr:hypothetical protein [Dendronalium phyllosphericum]MBH8577892.1 hypothetical protein [Dendronalium phyllosphericum CENA369]
MAIHLTKRMFVFANILAFLILMPGIALATPVEFYASSDVIFAQVTNAAKYSTSFSEIELTPLQHQQLQAVRQRRNKEIAAVLNSSQRTQLVQNLRVGNNINQALETLKLQPDQQDLVKAIVQFTNLKMKAILSRHSLTVGQK